MATDKSNVDLILTAKDRFSEAFDKLKKSVDEASAAQTRADETLSRSERNAVRYQRALKSLQDQQSRLSKEQNGFARSLENSQRDFTLASRLAEQYQKRVAGLKKELAAAPANSGLAKDLQRDLKFAENQVRKFTVQLDKAKVGISFFGVKAKEAGAALATNATRVNKAEQGYRKYSTAVNESANAQNRFVSSSTRANRALKNGLDANRTALSIYQRLRGQVLALTSTYIGLFGTLRQGQALFTQASELAQTEARLSVAFDGDPQAVRSEMGRLRKLADATATDFTALSEEFSRFAAGVLPAGALSLNETRFVFEKFAIQARVVGANVDETRGVFKALTQIMSKGKIQAEELRGQLGDRLPGAVTTLAKALNKSTEELNKMLENGELTADKMVDFAKEIGNQYEKELPAALQTPAAALARLNNSVFDLRNELIKAGVVDLLVDGINNLAAALRRPEIREGIKDFAFGVAQLVKNLPNALKHLKTFGLILATVFSVKALRAVAGMASSFKNLLTVVAASGVAGGKLRTLAGTILALGSRSTTLASKMKILGTILRGFAVAATGPVGIAIAGVVALGAAVAKLTGFFRNAGKEAAAFGQDLRNSFNQQGLLPEGKFEAAADALGKLETEVERVKAAIADNRKSAFGFINIAGLNKELEVLRAKRNELVKILKDAKGEVFEFTQLQQQERDSAVTDSILSDAELSKLQKRIARFNQQLAGMDPGTVAEQLEEVEAQYAGFIQRTKDALDVEGLTDSIKARLLAQLSVLETALSTETKLIKAQAQKEAAKATAELAREVSSLGRDLKQAQIESYDLTTDAGFQNAVDDTMSLIEDRHAETLARMKAANNAAGVSTVQALIAAEQATARTGLDENRTGQQEEAAAAALRPVNELLAQRALLIEEVNARLESGNATQAQATTEVSDLYDQFLPKLDQAAASAREFFEATADEDMLTRLSTLQQSFEKTGDVVANLIPTARQFNEEIASGLTGAIKEFTSGVKSAKDAFKDFALEFIQRIADMIIQQLILNAISGASGGVGGAISTGVGAAVRHSGGIVNSGGNRRTVPLAAFANAPLYHSGGIAGLRSNEVPSILERGEEVLTRDDPRHAFNGGGGQQQPARVKVINQIDSASVVSEALDSSAGETAVMNFMRANRDSIKTVLGQ